MHDRAREDELLRKYFTAECCAHAWIIAAIHNLYNFQCSQPKKASEITAHEFINFPFTNSLCGTKSI
jgi:hypothetical protein